MLVVVTARVDVSDEGEVPHLAALVEDALDGWSPSGVSAALVEQEFRVVGVDVSTGQPFDETVRAADEAEAVQQACSGVRVPARVDGGVSVESLVELSPTRGDED